MRHARREAVSWRRLSCIFAVLLGVVVLLVLVKRPESESGKASRSLIIEVFRVKAELAAKADLDDDADEKAAKAAAATAKEIPLPTPQKFEGSPAEDPVALAKLEEPPELPDSADDEAAKDAAISATGLLRGQPAIGLLAEKQTEKGGKGTKKKSNTFVGIVDMIANRSFTTSFHDCALVGSAAFMKGLKLGKEIDSYDTVIRVSRTPSEGFFRDFGNRTDILFAGLQADGYKMYTTRGMWYRDLGGKIELCRFGRTNCSFKNLVLKGSDSMEYGKAWADRYPLGKPGWKPSRTAFPLAHQSEVINQLAYALMYPERPSNGFQAFVTFGLMCKRLTLYGFSGEGAVDGNLSKTETRNMNREHTFYKNVVKGQAPELGVHGLHFDYYLQLLMRRAKSLKILSA